MKNKWVLFISGLTLASFGAASFSSAEMGMDAFSTFVMGLSRIMKLTFGTGCIVAGFFLLLLLALLDRSYVKIGGVIYAFGLGMGINLWFQLLPQSFYELPALFRLFVGILFFTLGIGCYILADVGSGAVEAFSLYLAAKFKLSLTVVRIGLDTLFLILGVLSGVTVGVGTVIGVALMGFLINSWLKLSDIFFQKSYSKAESN